MMRLAEGLVIAHAFLGASFLVAASAFPWFLQRGSTASAARSMMYLLCACTAGIAIIGLALFLLGVAGMLAPLPMLATFVALIVGCDLFWKQSPLRAQYWRARASALASCWDGPALAVYYVMLAIAIPAVIPNVGGDPIHYHVSYALDWAQRGSLVVDPYLRFPFYATNFSLLFAMLLALHAAPFLNFLVWSMGLLAALGVYAASREALETATRPFWAAVISLALTLAFAGSATFLRWNDTGYFDSGQAACALMSVLAMRLALIERCGKWLGAAVLAGAFLVGLKESYLLLLPVYFFACLYVARNVKMPPAKIVLVLAALLVFASPWYVRSAALSGDPVFPALNIALHGGDALISNLEWSDIQHDLSTPKSWRALVLLPWRAYARANTPEFREFGTTALMLALFVPGLVLFAVLCAGGRMEPGFALPIVFLSVLVGYWYASATYLRYSMIFYPLLAVCCAFLAAAVLKRRPALAPAFALLAVLAILPSPGSAEYYRDTFKNDYAMLPVRYTGDDSYLRLYEDGYIEEEFTTGVLRANGLQGPVYVVGGATEFHFRDRGIMSMGDWIGVSAYLRLFPAIQAGKAAPFVRSLRVQAVLVDPTFVIGGLDHAFEEQLSAAGFCSIPIPRSRYRLFVGRSCDRVRMPED